MDEERYKKSMSTSPLYRSTLDDVVDEDNVVPVTEQLKVFMSTLPLHVFHQIPPLAEESERAWSLHFCQPEGS